MNFIFWASLTERLFVLDDKANGSAHTQPSARAIENCAASVNAFRGSDHIDPRDSAIPLVEQQPVKLVRTAYWFAVRLHNYGWSIERIECTKRRGICAVEVDITAPDARLRTFRNSGHDARGTLPQVFVDTIQRLGASAEATGIDIFLELIGPLINSPYQAALTLSYRLIDDGWKLLSIRTDLAAGGILAESPGGQLIIFPASSKADSEQVRALINALGALSDSGAEALRRCVAWRQQQAPNTTPNAEHS